MAKRYALGLIGAGNMAEGIVAGVLESKVYRSDQIIAADPVPERRTAFRERFGVATTDDAQEPVYSADVVVLAVKPQVFAELARVLGSVVSTEQLVITIMAGWSAAAVAKALGSAPVRVVRVMPNLPIRVGAGVAAIYGGASATAADVDLARRMFDAAGQSIVLQDESLMDAVTAVSGSGPAYYYYLTEAIVAGGVTAGLSSDQALRLAANTCLGAARMMLETGLDPAELRRQVTSKGGTTQAAIESMNAAGVAEAVRQAVLAAAKRSKELGK
jgi:pyrroline-5-carboxylate reductase